MNDLFYSKVDLLRHTGGRMRCFGDFLAPLRRRSLGIIFSLPIHTTESARQLDIFCCLQSSDPVFPISIPSGDPKIATLRAGSSLGKDYAKQFQLVLNIQGIISEIISTLHHHYTIRLGEKVLEPTSLEVLTTQPTVDHQLN